MKLSFYPGWYVFAYKIIDLNTGKTYPFVTKEFRTYREFIGELVALNILWAGDLEFKEIPWQIRQLRYNSGVPQTKEIAVFNVKPNSQVKFQYVDRVVNKNVFPVETLYEAKEYVGKVLQVRDTEAQGLKWSTVRTNPNVERSQYLVTVQLPDNKIKSFYSGRMINLQQVKPKGFIRRLIGV